MNTSITPPASNGTLASTPSRLLSGWVHVFRAGTHTDSKGRSLTVTTADLDQMARNQALGASPVVLGHPKHDDPAWAWSQEFRRDGDDLYVKFKDIHPQFSALVDAGSYRERSLSIYKDPAHGWRVRHVGYLGAVPPALTGLSPEPVNFCGPDDECLEFSLSDDGLAWVLESMAAIFRSLREQTIERDGIDAADRVLPEWRLSAIETAAEQARNTPDSNNNFSQSPGVLQMNQAEIDRIREEERTRVTAEFSQQLTTANARAAAAEGAQRAARIATQINTWRSEGKVLPAETAGLAEFMAQLEVTDSEFSFSQGEGATAVSVKKTPDVWFAEFMAARKPVIQLGRTDMGADPAPAGDDSVALARAASEFQAEEAKRGVTISVTEAMAHVQKKQR